nr:hypothetical protein [Tanacetum cinerariifolium]
PFVVNQDPGKNSSQSPPQINHHCCYGCGDSLKGIFCHQCTCELCGKGAHYGYNCLPKVPIIPDPESFNNQTIGELPQTLPGFDPTCYFEDGNSFTYDSKSNIVHDSPNIFNPPSQPPFYSYEFCGNDARYGHYCTPQIPSCYDDDDDDDDDYTIAITHKKPDNSLSMGDEHLNTISTTELNKFIKSSVDNLIPNPSESEGEHECDVPACEVFTTFSNILFDADFDFYSSNDQSFFDEEIPKEIYSNPIDSLFDEFAGELTLLKLTPQGINETDCDPEEEIRLIKRLLYDNSFPRPLEEFISENSDTAIESFSAFPILVEDSDSLIEEIDLSLTPDDPMPPGIEEDDYDSERDILILEELLRNDSLSLPENELFHFDIPSSSRPYTKPPNHNSGILNVKVMGDISEHKVPMPRLMFTQPNFVPNQEKSPNLLPHLCQEAFQPSTECPMMIYGKNIPILDLLLSCKSQFWPLFLQPISLEGIKVTPHGICLEFLSRRDKARRIADDVFYRMMILEKSSLPEEIHEVDHHEKFEMSRDVLTVGSTMRIPLLYEGEYSQWVERFMNYLEEQTDGEAMINSIKNGDQHLPRVSQVSIAGTTSTKQPPLKDKSMWSDQEKKIQKIDRLARSFLIQGLPIDIYSLINSNKTAKDIWDALARHMLGSEYGEQDKKAAVLYEYETFKATKRELFLDTYIQYLQVINDLKKCGYSKDTYVNDAMGTKKKTVVVTSDPLALIAEKTNMSRIKEKVVISSNSEGSEADDFSELKKITALLAKAFNRRSENFIENHIDSQKDYDKFDVDHNDSEVKDHLVDKLIRKFNRKIAKCEETSMFKRYLVKSFEETGEMLPGEAEK